ncbi:unnamed protein product [Amoebophrya sp. A25]|nr:unnamed protein product [Amoebophrya sp. A25]|eukprot:GSA25T00009332001.1
MPSCLVPLADGSEELEAVSIWNPLRRAGVEVTVASIKGDSLQVTCARGTVIKCDKLLKDCLEGVAYDCVALPGGMPGASNFAACEDLVTLLKSRHAAGQTNAAVCASPAVVFAAHKLLNGKATCYPAPKFVEMLGDKMQSKDAPVVIDGNVVTSVGPGTSLEFGLRLVGLLCGEEKMKEIGEAMKFQGSLDS